PPAVLLAALLGLVACAPAAAPAGSADAALRRLRGEGNRFVSPDGQTVARRGVSLSGPDGPEPRGRWNRGYCAAARAWHAHVVRSPVRPARSRDRGDQAFLPLLDEGIRWAGELGMYVIIAWHSIGNLRTERFTRDSYETTRVETLRFWETIAARYAGDPV